VDLKEQIQNVVEEFPSLKFNAEVNALWGELCVDEDDSYEVVIYLYDFPDNFPVVLEVGERIPQKVERHVYKAGNCCFTTNAKKDIILKSEVHTLKQFIEKVVLPYFQNNSYYEIHKEYKYGGYSHDSEISTHETYKDILDIQSIYLMQTIISKRLTPSFRIRENGKCYCNSNKKIKHCSVSFPKLELLVCQIYI